MAEMNAVARLGKPHGIRGEVTVEVLTDAPEERFVPDTVFVTEPDIGPLTLTGARWHRERLLLSFAEVTDRTRAEQIRNTRLMAPVLDDEEDDDAWRAEELTGLSVLREGTRIGEVTDLLFGTAQDLLEIRLDEDDRAVLVPFVEQIVPEVDVEAGHIVITPPGGLIEEA
ncbi:ribosome maturation factor RimM [Sediminivirga luteola]|uniref:Ribosome maturation factor RimM n=1 Tax=Sediminivirga luteola TaxID=1774748 RepID=A0A8J2TV70_9MICO|nr:ribosome maturation factor RimM [Sediminivirga luteola]GGA03213.1 ribosome maturation factor RimM [Sediminivirga luteola]